MLKYDAQLSQPSKTPDLTMVGFLSNLTLPFPLPAASRDLTTLQESLYWSALSSPKTTCLPSSQLVTTVVMKNWEPLLQSEKVSLDCVVERKLFSYVLGPALAIERSPGLVCLREKFSSANFSP
jgi:hypothetical protein